MNYKGWKLCCIKSSFPLYVVGLWASFLSLCWLGDIYFQEVGGFIELCAIGLQLRKQAHDYRLIYGNLCIFHNGKPKVKGNELSHMC